MTQKDYDEGGAKIKWKICLVLNFMVMRLLMN